MGAPEAWNAYVRRVEGRALGKDDGRTLRGAVFIIRIHIVEQRGNRVSGLPEVQSMESSLKSGLKLGLEEELQQ